MDISNYTNGFPGGVAIKNVPLIEQFSGSVYWVDSAIGSNGNDGSFLQPFASVDYAVGQCTASNGDKIMLKTGHAEALSSATALAIDVAGITIIGEGVGTDRPTFTLDTAAAATIAVSGANTVIKNCIFTANFADIAELFTVTAVNFQLIDCKFTATAVDMNFVEIVATSTTDNEADGLSFVRCEWIEVDTATTSLINVDADIDRLTILDCYVDLAVNGVLSSLAEVAAGKDLTNVNIKGNYVSRLVAASAVQLITFVDTTTTNTGIVADNKCRTLDTAGELLVTAGTNISFFDNKSTSAIDKSGYILPAVDS